ncbi:MAG: hypothetical protein J0M18_00320 [Ignavibacteria bacterium]|nr:hypothetical protein [Ignavibacteria bacterium]
MNHFNKKYLGFLLILLVLTANVSYAYSQMNCRMNMKKGCVCEDQTDKENSPVINKIDCCKEVVKEINNVSILQILPSEENINFSDDVFFTENSNLLYDSIHLPIDFKLYNSPPKDIPILNSNFRI